MELDNVDIDNVNEVTGKPETPTVSRQPPGPAYGPVVYFAPQHDPAVKLPTVQPEQLWSSPLEHGIRGREPSSSRRVTMPQY